MGKSILGENALGPHGCMQGRSEARRRVSPARRRPRRAGRAMPLRFGDITVARLAQPGSKVVRLASAEPKGGAAGFSRTEVSTFASAAMEVRRIVQRTARLDQGRGSVRG